MNNSTRRGFLAMVGVGAAAAGAAAIAPSAIAATPSNGVTPRSTVSTEQLPADAAGSLVAYVHDVRNGQLAVMVDGREVVVTDKALVAKLAKAVSAAARS